MLDTNIAVEQVLDTEKERVINDICKRTYEPKVN